MTHNPQFLFSLQFLSDRYPPVCIYGTTMIAVETGLYIGSVSDLKEPEVLTNAGITHILTVDSEEPNISGFHLRFVQALDDSSTDLLSRLDGCVQFITEALSASAGKPSSVLVHWYVA